MFSYYLVKYLGKSPDFRVLPSFLEVALQIPLFIVLQEITAYYTHRWYLLPENMKNENVILCKLGPSTTAYCTSGRIKCTTNGLHPSLWQLSTTIRSIISFAICCQRSPVRDCWTRTSSLRGFGRLGQRCERSTITADITSLGSRRRYITTFTIWSSLSASECGESSIISSALTRSSSSIWNAWRTRTKRVLTPKKKSNKISEHGNNGVAAAEWVSAHYASKLAVWFLWVTCTLVR